MSFGTLPYRFYFRAKALAGSRLIRRSPRLMGILRAVKNRVLPSALTWVQIRSGLSAGLWMRLQLPAELGFWCGEHEIPVQDAIRAHLSPTGVLYDVGAHAGFFALGAARSLCAAGHVIAFEADPENVESLRENAARNGLLDIVEVVPFAVWSHTAKTMTFRRGGIRRSHGGVEADGHSPVLAAGDRIPVPAISLDEFIARGGPIPHLVKVDVEGAEYEVLKGGATLFSKQRPLLIVEVHDIGARKHIRQWLDDFRYAGDWVVPPEEFPCCVYAWPEGLDGAFCARRSGHRPAAQSAI